MASLLLQDDWKIIDSFTAALGTGVCERHTKTEVGSSSGQTKPNEEYARRETRDKSHQQIP